MTSEITGKHLINKYTHPKRGMLCRTALIMEEVLFKNKFFLNLSLDRQTSNPVLIYSKQGGHPLDRLLDTFPETVHKHQIDFRQGLDVELAASVAEEFGCPDHQKLIKKLLANLYRCFTERDCLSLTLNPLVINDRNELTTLGCKIELDDSANFRQPELFAKVDYSQYLW